MTEIKPLNIQITRAVVNGRMLNVMTYDEYLEKGDNSTISSGIIMEYKGKEIVLPIRGEFSTQVTVTGLYSAGCIDICVYPEEPFLKDYIPARKIVMGNTMDQKKILENSEVISRLDEPWITTPDNITKLPISPEDQPEMVCLKTALNQKEIDLDKYAGRFGDNFPNDKRQLKNNSVTLNIIKRFCDKCDMECLITLRDKNPNVPNPIGREISVSLTEMVNDED